jgi:hypothetical protein
MKKVKKASVREGEQLPCNQSNIIHTEELDGWEPDEPGVVYLRVWYVGYEVEDR